MAGTRAVMIAVDFQPGRPPIHFTSAYEIRAALRAAGHRAYLFPMALITEPQRPPEPTLVFPVDEWLPEGSLRRKLEAAGIPFVGSSAAVVERLADKRRMRDELAAVVSIPPARLLPDADAIDGVAANIDYPCVVKPARGGGSIGVSYAETPLELTEAVRAWFAHDPGVGMIVEAYIHGREVTVWTMETVDGGLASAPIAIDRGDSPIFDRSRKIGLFETADQRPVLDLPTPLMAAAVANAEKAFRHLGLKGIGRADIIVTEEGIPVILEVNPTPTIHAEGEMSLEAAFARPLPDLLASLVALAEGR